MALYKKYVIHKVAQNERWDDLARIYYGDCFKFLPIIEANPTVEISPFLQIDTNIIIPIFEDEIEQVEGLPSWKQ